MTHKLAIFALPLALAFSGPAFAKVAAEKVERAAADKLAVTWIDQAPVDVYVTDRPSATIADAKLISRADADGRLETAAAGSARTYFLLRDTRDNTVVRVAERALPLEHGSNFRDLGGYPAVDGKHVRWGQLFRSGASFALTDGDVAKTNALGLKDLVDLRSSEERSLAPTRIDGVRYTAVGYPMNQISGPGGPPTQISDIGGAYRRFATNLAPQVRVLFRTLLTTDGPVVYNCSAGQDRTGFATALILTALGVPRDVILADYHLSTVYRQPAYEMPKIDAAAYPGNTAAAYFAQIQKEGRMVKPQPLYDAEKRALLDIAFEDLETRYGSVEGYLQKEIGITAADIAKLRAIYLE